MQDWLHTMSNMCAFEPVNPVTEGHLIVIPFAHVESALSSPATTGQLFAYASSLARVNGIQQANLITNAGRHATQSIMHVHVHIVPRRRGDRLLLPWSPQSGRKSSVEQPEPEEDETGATD
jgi:histidine triad (HIT) family protein